MPFVPTHFKGKSIPLTVITPVPRWKRFFTWAILFVFKHLSLGFVKKLAFIHFARWILVPTDKLPRLDPQQPAEDVSYDMYLFTTNFNGSWDQYIDAFGRIEVVSKGLNMLWYTSAGFPGPWPMRLFKRYVRYFECQVNLYYNAYPGASVRDITMALQLEEPLDRFIAETAEDMEPAEFRDRYEAFLNEVSPSLGMVGTKSDLEALNYRAGPVEEV